MVERVEEEKQGHITIIENKSESSGNTKKQDFKSNRFSEEPNDGEMASDALISVTGESKWKNGSFEIDSG